MAGVQANIRTFIAPPKGPGKTSPAFLEDLLLYDRLHPLSSGASLLVDPCWNHIHVNILGQLLHPETCQHAFITKERQSQLPELDERPRPNSVYVVSAVCRHCRVHTQLKIDYSRWDRGERPCPNQDYPLHHLVHAPWQENLARSAWTSKNPQSEDIIHVLECSSKTCSATITLQVALPILTLDAIHTLIDKDLLAGRTDEAFRLRAGLVEGMKRPTPRDVLSDLRIYLRNARDNTSKPIVLDNKRFVVRFGPEGSACRDVLESLKFTFKPGECWEVPRPNPDDELPLQDPLNVFLDNAEHELSLLLSQLPSEGHQLSQDDLGRDAQRDFARALGCQDYHKIPSSRTTQMDPAARPTPYTVLGVPENAADDVIIFAYDQQVKTDPLRAPWYFTSLKQVHMMRSSEVLETKIAVELSEGKFDSAQLIDAYKYFGWTIQAPPEEDDNIIGVFQSRLQDSRLHESEMRDQLRQIGVHRQSKKIIDAAEDALNTYEQALRFLGAAAETMDEFIETLYTHKTIDDSSVKDKALKAVKIIAEHRKSKPLQTWLDTGKMGDSSMDIGEAYAALQIDDHNAEDDLVISAYQVIVSDQPLNVDTYNRALRTIAETKQSPSLLRFLGGQGIATEHGSVESPVGLENIGNTCYLNSLLQFFFTLPELRNIVLDFEKYKMDSGSAAMSMKKVGQRPVTVGEVQIAQKFVASLGNLFEEMIKSPQSSITPQQELARLTLETEDAKQKVKRRSTIVSGGRPSLGHIDSMPILGPLLPPSETVNGIIPEEAVQSPTEVDGPSEPFPRVSQDQGCTRLSDNTHMGLEDMEMKGTGSTSSDTTLVSRPGTEEDTPMSDTETRSQQQDILDNKENLLPPKALDSTRRSQSPDKHSMPLSEVSSSVLNSQAGVLAMKPSNEQKENEKKTEVTFEPPPNKPPPIPPRPQHQQQQIAISKLEEYARQQDVTEVIMHCLFQLSCAMRPTGVDKTGEQIDEIHELFYGKTRYHFVPEHATEIAEDNLASVITRLYSKPEDIYAALDTAFDIDELENGSKRFLSITRLPPIFSIQLDRVEFDNQSKTYRKSKHHVEVKEEIYLDRYLESEPVSDLMDRRKQNWQMKQELGKMVARREELEAVAGRRPDIPTVFEDAKSILENLQEVIPDEDDEQLNISPQTIETLGMLAETSRTELEDLQGSARNLQTSINSNFTDLTTHRYRLHAAFFHRGTQGSGHYWVYIFDFKQEIWRKYNDGYVTVIHDTTEILGRPSQQDFDSWSGPANPYFLVYVKAGEEDRLTQSVHRNIVWPPPDSGPPPRSQMTEFPPGVMDYEMTETNEAISERPKFYTPIHGQPLVEKEGDWESGNLAEFYPNAKW